MFSIGQNIMRKEANGNLPYKTLLDLILQNYMSNIYV